MGTLIAMGTLSWVMIIGCSILLVVALIIKKTRR